MASTGVSQAVWPAPFPWPFVCREVACDRGVQSAHRQWRVRRTQPQEHDPAGRLGSCLTQVARDRIADAKQLDAVEAGKPFAQLQAAGMKTAVMDEIMRQREPALKEAVEASLAGEIGRAFEKLGSNVAEVKPDNIAGAVAGALARALAGGARGHWRHGAEPRARARMVIDLGCPCRRSD